MLMSRYDPVQKRMVFGQQLGQSPAQMAAPGAPALPNAITMPDGSVQNYTPSVTPQDPDTSGFGPMPDGSTRTALTPGAITPLPPPPAAAPGQASVNLPQISVGPAPVGVAANANANAGGGMMKQPLGQYYTQLEQERGLPQGFLAKTRAIESSNGTKLANPNSSARGDFQFINSTAKQMGLQDPMDPYASAKAAADLAKQNMDGIVKRTGQQPDGADLYVAHQQGLGGYLGLRNGKMPAGQASSLNGGNGQTAGGFLSMWRDKFNGAKVANLDGFTPPPSADANQGQGPTVANAAAQGLPTGSVTPSGVPAVKDDTYKGGLLGLAGIGDQNAPGMGKDVLGKLGDMAGQPGGGALGGFAKAIGALAQGQQSAPAGGITIQANTQAHDANPGFMQYLDPKARRRAGFLSGG